MQARLPAAVRENQPALIPSLRGGSKTGPGRRRKSSLYVMRTQLFLICSEVITQFPYPCTKCSSFVKKMSNKLHQGALTIIIFLMNFASVACNREKKQNAQFFQVSILVHPYHLLKETTGNSVNAQMQSQKTKLEHYFWNSVYAKTRLSGLRSFRYMHKFIQFRCKCLNHILRVIEIEFVSKWLCIEMTLYRNDRTPFKLFKKIPNSMTQSL